MKVTHSLEVPEQDKLYTSSDMSGKLVDHNGNAYNPCKPYKDKSYPCPEEVQNSFKKDSLYDVVPMQALLEASGLNSLDSTSKFMSAITLFALETFTLVNLLMQLAHPSHQIDQQGKVFF